QRRLSPEFLERFTDIARPEYVARIHGIDYAWVYRNKTHEPALRYIHEHAQPDDTIVVSRPSLLADDYAGPLPLWILGTDSSRQQTLQTLAQAATAASRVWYVRYAPLDPDPKLEWLDTIWRTHAFALDKQSYTDVDLFLWQTAGGVPFVGAEPTRREVGLRFGDALELAAMSLNAPGQYGRDVALTLEWRALRDLDRYYAEYVHVVDETGRRWGQGDRWLLDVSLRPTT
ncbi:MAG: hypothetical protein H5T69_20740, partial [Chloroflexi bacterium]|nr:hypothetical protein [Chloroflexota bacterium]